ncbi:MAG TPA: FxsA family protein [Pseudomonadales bacterium]|nr:FxsA family protein [Pseudomonadales bacterium]
MPLFVIFVVLPIVEMWVLIETGAHIGGLSTIALVLLTAVIGAFCLRIQGMSMLLEAQRKMQVGELPAQEMFGGLLLAVAGVCLVTPGFITDSVGFLLLVPPVRLALGKAILKKMQVSGQQQFYSHHTYTQQGPFGTRHEEDVIEGEVVNDPDDNPKLR